MEGEVEVVMEGWGGGGWVGIVVAGAVEWGEFGAGG